MRPPRAEKQPPLLPPLLPPRLQPRLPLRLPPRLALVRMTWGLMWSSRSFNTLARGESTHRSNRRPPALPCDPTSSPYFLLVTLAGGSTCRAA